MRASVVIVTWNSSRHVLESLRSIRRELASVEHEIVVVDNASTDDTVEGIRNSDPQVRVLTSDRNTGFAAGVNRGLEQTRGRWVLILNPDAVLLRGTAEALAWAESRPRLSLLGAFLEDSCGAPQLSHYEFPGFRHLVREYLLRDFRIYWTAEGKDAPFLAEGISGASMWVNRSAQELVGPMDTRFWLYCEEIDWCRRFAAAGYEIAIDPRWHVRHEGAGSAGQLGHRAFALLQESRERYFQKYWGPGGKWLFRAILWMGLGSTLVATGLGRATGRLSAVDARERVRLYLAGLLRRQTLVGS